MFLRLVFVFFGVVENCTYLVTYLISCCLAMFRLRMTLIGRNFVRHRSFVFSVKIDAQNTLRGSPSVWGEYGIPGASQVEKG